MSDQYARLSPQRMRAPDDEGWEQPWYRTARARQFFTLFVGVTLLGWVITFFQDATWRSTAVVLMSAPSAIDERESTFNSRNVAIQSRLLLAPEVVEQISRGTWDFGLSEEELGQMLKVEAIADTDVVLMTAEGSEPMILPDLVNRWIEVYIATRLEELNRQKSYTLDQLEDELAGFELKVQQAREELEAYRRQHDIVSAKREENEVLAQLDGLNRSLNTAIEEEVRAKARLDALLESIRLGDRVVPADRVRQVSDMEAELRRLETEFLTIEARYTDEYINKEPQLRAKAERVEELRQSLAAAYENGRATEVAIARQNLSATQQAVAEIGAKLALHREKVAEFTEIYATHDALVADLAELESLNREAQARQVRVQVRDIEKYPEVSVIQRAPGRSERAGPDYSLWLMGSVAVGFLVAIISVWLRGFLAHQSQDSTFLSVEWVPTDGEADRERVGSDRQAQERLREDPTTRLGHPGPQGEPT